MACFSPIQAYRVGDGEIVFHDVGKGNPIELPCGQCIGCRLERSRQWAMRCVHEASLYPDNCFITLTYDDDNLPHGATLVKSDFQKFMKRLREYIKPNKVRYYHAGEYGSKNNRPHYHAILFGINFNDWVYLFDSPSGHAIYTSPTLEKIWNKGFVTIGEVTFESSGYVARYCMKKINGQAKDVINQDTGLKPYERYDERTGEVTEVLPEYSTMSRRPGIGHGWISRYTSDCYPKDFTTVRGMRMRPPKYYDKYIESIDPDMYDDIKAGRNVQAYVSDDNSETRLLSRQIVKEAQYKQLKRTI